MASSQSVTDRLIKQMHVHLAGQMSPARLRSLGWFDFRSHDHPDTTDAITLAYSAFLYLSLDESGNWNNAQDVLIALIAFLRATTGNQATESNVRDLANLLRQKPVRKQEVQDWFGRVFR